MIRLLSRLLMLAASIAVVVGTASAQTRKVYYLDADFGLSFMQSKLQVKNIVADTNAAKAKYPQFYARRRNLGKTGTQFMNLSAFDAAFGEAVWQGQGGANGSAPTGVLNSNNHIYIPSGEYWCTVTGTLRGTEVFGAGGGYVGADGKNSVNTELVVWHEQWQDDPNERHLLQTDTWDKGKGNTYYNEGLTVAGIAFNGRQREFPTQKFNSSGLRLWYPGEVSHITHLYPSNFRTAGIEVFGATPLDAGYVSVFDNVVAGVIFYSSGATVNWDVLSGDDNGAMFYCKHGYSDTGGGAINFGAIKSESFVATQDRAHRGQRVGIIEGQGGVNIGVVSVYAGLGYVDAAFILDTRSPFYPPQNMSLNVGVFKVKGYKHAIMQIPSSPVGLTAQYWSTRGDFTNDGFSWSSYNGGVFQWNVASIPTTKVAHGCNEPVAFSKTGYPTGCTPYRYIIDGPPRSATTVYLDATTTPPPPTPGTWSCTAWSAWGACTGGQQTRTRTCTCGPAGSTCTDPKPAESESQACTVTPPPPTGSGIDPSDVLVVTNSADSRTAAWGAAYAQAWGIPASNIIAVNGGTSHDATATVAAAMRTAIEAKGKQFTVLAMEYPSRVGSQSITSYITFGQRNVSALTVSPLYGYTGFKPRTDNGAAPSWLLVSDKYIRRDAHGTNPSGQAILLLAKDQTGTPRGSARAGQTAAGVTVWDNRTYSGIGIGNNACNYISTLCWRADRKPGATPVIAAYQSMYQLGDAGTTAWAKGFFGDHVTSYGGFLPAGSNGLNGQNQTPLTYHLDRGASFSVGTVSEPYQGSGGSLAQQFANVSLFHPRFVGGVPVGVAAWSAVQCPDRALMAGDGLCAPWAK